MILSKLVIFFIILISNQLLIAQNWQFEKSPTLQNLARIDMLSDNLGLAVSYDGLILKFNGINWSIEDSLQKLTNWDYSRNDSLSNYSLNIGDIYTVYTQNDSIAWLAVNNIAHRSYLLIKVSLKSKKIHTYFLPVKIRSIDFWGDGTGIAVGESGGYLFENGNWIPLKLPISVDYKSVKFVGENKLFICGEKGTLLKWDGSNWEVIETDLSQTLRDMDFISENEGWIVGDGVVIHYKDGKIDYEIAESTNELWAVDMINSTFGYAVGEKGTILKYNGVSWDLEDINSDIDLHDIELLDFNFGYVVGARGSILKLTDSKSDNNFLHQFLFSDQVHLGSNYLMDRIDDVYGISIADFNNDNRPDFYITCYKSLNHLLINQDRGYFKDFIIQSGTGGYIENRIGKEKYEYGSIAADFDRDNDTDLFLFGKSNTSRYFINNGQAKFKDWTSFTEIPSGLEILDGALGDFNEDGYPDIVLADQVLGVRIFINKKYNKFSEQSLASLNLPYTGIRAIKISDLNMDNHQDILALFTHGKLVVLLNDGNAKWSKSQKLVSHESNVSGFGNSITFGDFNRDGFNDFFISTDDGKDALFIYDYSDSIYRDKAFDWNIKEGGRSYSSVSGDFNHDGYEDLFVSRFGNDYLYINVDGKKFIEKGYELIYSKAGYLSGLNYGTASCDIDEDGNIDLFVGNTNFWSSLLQNKLESDNFIKLNIIGVHDTKEALGAKVWIWPSGKSYSDTNLIGYKEILPSTGLFSQNFTSVILGLRNIKIVDIKIRFLNGDIKYLYNIESGSTLHVKQSSGIKEYSYNISRTILQIVNRPTMIWEIFKFILFAIIIYGSVRFIEYRYNWRHTHTVIYILTFFTLYLISIVFIQEKGFLYNIFPFGMIIFAVFVLVLVNEPIRKTTAQQRIRQNKIQEASTKLSRVQVFSDATVIAKDALKIISPYQYIAIYIYHTNGNIFLLSEHESSNDIKFPTKFEFERIDVQKFQETEAPLLVENSPFNIEIYRGSFVFPLVRKKQLLGSVIIKLDEKETLIKDQNIELTKYLLLQLAIALDNLRILNELGDHEKISAIGTFSSGIIHNLKNPIEGLRMIIELLRDEIDKSDSRIEYVDELYNGIIALRSKLVHSFDFVKYNKTKNAKLGINNLLLGIIHHHENSSYQLFKLSLSSEEIYIYGDSEQLKFVFENIIQNAIEASDLKEPIIIKTHTITKNNCQIDIIDSGDGIPDEIIGKLFDMFFSTKGKSRGLGLNLVKRIINSHNGFINVSKEKMKGTKFSVILPIIKEDESI